MAADLHIHVFAEGELTEAHFRNFFSNHLVSKYFNPMAGAKAFDEGYEAVADSDNVHVGEVSWLKAGLTGDSGTYVPDTIGEISKIIGEDQPVINHALIGKIKDAFALANDTEYSLSSEENVIKFLEDNIGKRAFTVSW